MSKWVSFMVCWHNTYSEVYSAEQIVSVPVPAKQEPKMGAHITSGNFGNALLCCTAFCWTGLCSEEFYEGLLPSAGKTLWFRTLIVYMEKDHFQRAQFEVANKKNTYTPNNSSILSFSSLFFFNVFLKNVNFSQEITILKSVISFLAIPYSPAFLPALWSKCQM